MDAARAPRWPLEPDAVASHWLDSGLLYSESSNLLLELQATLLVLLTGFAVGAFAVGANYEITDPKRSIIGESQNAVIASSLKVGKCALLSILPLPSHTGICLHLVNQTSYTRRIGPRTSQLQVFQMYELEWKTALGHPKESAFSWYENDLAFLRLMPPWEVAEGVYSDFSIEVGSKSVFRIPMGPLKMTWEAEFTAYEPPHKFEDIMVRGPFWKWRHEHVFLDTESGSVVDDRVHYQVPFGALGHMFAGRWVRKRLRRMFRARELRLQRDMDRHAKYYDRPRKRILVAGSSGMIGTQLVAFLDTGGHDVWRLVRRPVTIGAKEIPWNPDRGELDASQIEGFDVIIHLGGAGIGDRRWSSKRKKIIRDSRVDSTALLADAVASLDGGPEAFVLASAVGWYGNRADEELTEASTAGEGFLPDVCADWEGAADAVEKSGVRTVYLRSGIVLSPTGGALGKMLLPFKLGIGGAIGGGKQWMPWISLDDEIYAIYHLIMNEESRGPYNLTAPRPVRQEQFAKTLGGILRRPTIAPTPGLAIRLVFGEMGGNLALESQRVLPERLRREDYQFVHEDIEAALRDSMGIWREI